MQKFELLIRKDEKGDLIDKNSYKNIDAYNNSTYYSKLFYLWSYRTIILSSITSLRNNHLGKLTEENRVENFCQKFTDLWHKQKYKKIKNHALFKTLLKSNQDIFFEIFFFLVISTFFEFSEILLMRLFIINYENPQRTSNYELKIGITLILVKFFGNITSKRVKFLEVYLSDRPLIQLNHLIMTKVLRESPSNSKNKFSQGELINLIASDSDKVKAIFEFLPTTFFIPIKIFVYIIILFKYLGTSFISGVIIMSLIMIFNYFLQEIRKKIEIATNKVKDSRMKITTELLNNLKFAKLFSWENEFTKRIFNERSKELKLLWERSLIRCITTTIFASCPNLVTICTIAAYYYFEKTIVLSNVFLLINIFSYIQKPLTIIPILIVYVNDLLVGLARIQRYLDQDEIDFKRIKTGETSLSIKIVNGNFSWGKEIEEKKKNINENIVEINSNSHKIILKNINLSLEKGQLLMIIGEVGSGKSSLIQAILNNLMIIGEKKGEIHVNGSVSYVSQNSWIRNNTLRDNITFFNEFNQEKYEKVINKCELLQDLKILPGGDLTEIGEKGINLSGGQKARISIARAIYSESDIYLFDDPISALDAHVGERIMKNCILEHLKGKTRVLVTHAVQYLNFSDLIIVMKKGEIFWEGKFEELKDLEFYKEYIRNLKRKEKNEKENEVEEYNHDKKNTSVKRITTNEEEEESKDLKCYIKFFSFFGGKYYILATILSYLILQFTYSFSDIWLAIWSKFQNTLDYPYLLIYSISNTLSILFIYLSLLLISNGSINSSKIFHEKIIQNLVNAPINTYHDIIPKGRILNRLSKDLREIDLNLAWMLGMLPLNFFKIMASIIICTYLVYHCIIFFPIFVYLGIKLTILYTKASNDLTLIERINRSPIINIFTETVSGAITIRAFKSEKHFINLYLSKLQELYKVNIFKNGISQWYSLILGTISVFFFATLVIFIFFFSKTLGLTAQNIALILNSIIHLQLAINEFLEKITVVENSMVSVDRCLKCIDIPSEAELYLDNDNEHKDWPSEGKIQFLDYSVRYRPNTPLVLKNLSFSISSGQKIGVVGRTGCGKSTLCLSLFRILEKDSGKILIDDVDISTLGLHKLRSGLTIIPQDPMMFEGTLRYNIDPLNLYSDEEIIQVLREVSLSSFVDNEKGLDMLVQENGVNISSGERQLLSISRAILKKSKIVVLDEATANIDFKTEVLIQTTIRKYFKQSTLITIAHRIQTIIDYDKILVLKNGEVIEFDSPKNLINNKSSDFYQLYSKSV